MRIDLADIGDLDRFDVCVIGAGPAGLTVALRLGRAGKRVLLLEGGGFDWSAESQALYAGASTGDPYLPLDESRLRQFGGTSGHWGGWCRPLDARDFEAKPGFPDAAWPIGKADLDPYLAEASEILEIPEVAPDRYLEGSDIREIDFVFSPPVRFGEKYREATLASGRVFLALDASVERLVPGAGGIAGVVARASDGAAREVRAGAYVLAAGGIENSRILLWSNAAAGGGVVPREEALGRYWMEHPHYHIGAAIVSDAVLPDDRMFGVGPETQTRLGILQCGLSVRKEPYAGTKKLIADIACVAPDLGAWAMRQVGRRLACGAKLSAAWEQAPRPESRVVLSDAAWDRFGVPRAELVWRKGPEDLRTMRETTLAFAEHLARTDAGRLKLEDWVVEEGAWPAEGELGGAHHMGGTRMADDPAKGMVDSDCRVHGAPNLFVAGSSVFPSCGHANPTLTIVQLALRLAERLGA